jgi:hypothetical protein
MNPEKADLEQLRPSGDPRDGDDQDEDQEVGDGVELLHPHCAAVLRRVGDSKM